MKEKQVGKKRYQKAEEEVYQKEIPCITRTNRKWKKGFLLFLVKQTGGKCNKSKEQTDAE